MYLPASRRNGTLYLGVTSDLVQRIWQHREHLAEGFSKEHDVTRLVWFEQHATMDSAITREKRVKKWRRDWKIDLIEQTNPYWNDLWSVTTGQSEVTGFPRSRE
ncbi:MULTISPECIES: GIY-YIG nuclease family protein [Novilysobacter]|uniref:GIY-YIG nuclease family protein n=1 Tax=Novilysobacter TaxID=3382699 RepID=UPI002ED94E94